MRRYALAASILIAVGVVGLVARQAFFAVPPGSRAAVRSVTGTLHRVSASAIGVLAPGQELLDGEAVRTARGSLAALRLSDGSVVEMGERAELFVTARGQDTTIHLERGSIIVQAAKRKTGELLVASGDCTVKVTGTVFSVNRGLKGSRVSVLEGQVRVARAGAGEDTVLAPGEQWTTGPAVASVPVRDEVAWSAEVDRHLALLGEVKALREAWRAVAMPGVRYESPLLPLLPEGAVVYAGIPNYGEALFEAHRLFEDRLRESAVLRDWWTAAAPERHGGPGLAATIEKIRTFADFLGDEVVLALASGTRHVGLPVVLAEVRRDGLREALEQELLAHETEAGRRPVVRIVGDDDAVHLTPKADLFVLLRRNVVAVTPSREILLAVAARLEGAGPGLMGTPFGARIAQAYEHGAGILFAADLERITAASLRHAQGDPRQAATLRRAGLDGLRHLVFERRSASGDEVQTQAVLAFAGPRRGIPSWIAAPAPM
ncbi:MAG TPA: FecR family protein, partial [Gemmatimonadales bacterium]|nr:FecR family protein [Gemmatimonadales bacterium]